jgi:hypothetical protein
MAGTSCAHERLWMDQRVEGVGRTAQCSIAQNQNQGFPWGHRVTGVLGVTGRGFLNMQRKGFLNNSAALHSAPQHSTHTSLRWQLGRGAGPSHGGSDSR